MRHATDYLSVFDSLSDKQREVLRLVSEGLTSKETARKLGISESAVNQRIEMIRQRLGGMQRSQIARLYRLQNTVVMTIPTSSSLTGNPIVVQPALRLDEVVPVEGVANPTAPEALQGGDVLHPSTTSRRIEFVLTVPANRWSRAAFAALLVLCTAATVLVGLSIARELGVLLR